jgi:hypothetical protein
VYATSCDEAKFLQRYQPYGLFHIHKTPGLGVFHGFFEFVWNLGIIVFHHELGYLRQFVCRQFLNLLNDFRCAHGLIVSQNSVLARHLRSLSKRFNPNSEIGDG